VPAPLSFGSHQFNKLIPLPIEQRAQGEPFLFLQQLFPDFSCFFPQYIVSLQPDKINGV